MHVKKKSQVYFPGTLYTGTADGKILSIKDRNVTLLVHTGIHSPECGRHDMEPVCGRPKGMKVGPDGKLYVVDSYKGLLRLDLKENTLETLVSSEQGT